MDENGPKWTRVDGSGTRISLRPCEAFVSVKSGHILTHSRMGVVACSPGPGSVTEKCKYLIFFI
jgi:hypothetical protein